MAIDAQLIEALGSTKVLVGDAIPDDRRHDYWFLSHLHEHQGRHAPKPACVVRPTSVEDVVATVNTCRDAGVPLIPFGLGSGVCGGVIGHPDHVLLDMSSMNKVRDIDATNLLASFDAGYNGLEAENKVAEQGLTIGHWPQSISVSSVGGWVATRASGQFSTGYGNIEDIIYSIEAVMPDGSVINAGKAPRAAAGPDLRHLLLGSEGTMGIITGVTFSLRRAAEKQSCTAFFAITMVDGFEAQREIIQSGWEPVVMRQYDAQEARRVAGDHFREGLSLVIMVHEGPSEKVDAEIEEITKIAEGFGLESAPSEIVTRWLEHRNHVPSWGELLDKNLIVDTVEISAPWTKVNQIYETAVASLKEGPSNLIGSAHSSHVYRSGINLYFTFVAQTEKPDEMADIYTDNWQRVLTATAKNGGGIAHHHGIGRVRKDYLVNDLGETGVATLRKVKQALDPKGIMNPGVLLPDA